MEILLSPFAENSKIFLRIGMMLGHTGTTMSIFLIGEGHLWWPMKQADYPYAKLDVANLVPCNSNTFIYTWFCVLNFKWFCQLLFSFFYLKNFFIIFAFCIQQMDKENIHGQEGEILHMHSLEHLSHRSSKESVFWYPKAEKNEVNTKNGWVTFCSKEKECNGIWHLP